MNRNFLIVIDMQKDFTTGVLGNDMTNAVADRVAAKITEWKQNNPNGHVIATFDTHNENYANTQEGQKLPVPHCIEGTDGWQLDERIAAVIGEEYNDFTPVWKNTFGASRLMSSIFYPETITLIGVCTDICVISNALLLKAFFPEVPINVVEDCCAGVTKESHDNAINAMKACQINII